MPLIQISGTKVLQNGVEQLESTIELLHRAVRDNRWVCRMSYVSCRTPYVLCLMSTTICVEQLDSTIELLHRAVPDNRRVCRMSYASCLILDVLCLMSATCVEQLESVELLHRAVPDNHHFILHQRNTRAKHSHDTEPEPDGNQPSAHAFTSQYLYFCTTVSICTFVLSSKYFCASKACAPLNFAVVPHPVQIHIYMLTYADVCSKASVPVNFAVIPHPVQIQGARRGENAGQEILKIRFLLRQESRACFFWLSMRISICTFVLVKREN